MWSSPFVWRILFPPIHLLPLALTVFLYPQRQWSLRLWRGGCHIDILFRAEWCKIFYSPHLGPMLFSAMLFSVQLQIELLKWHLRNALIFCQMYIIIYFELQNRILCLYVTFNYLFNILQNNIFEGKLSCQAYLSAFRICFETHICMMSHQPGLC